MEQEQKTNTRVENEIAKLASTFVEELTKKISLDEISSIFRDIEINQKQFAWVDS